MTLRILIAEFVNGGAMDGLVGVAKVFAVEGESTARKSTARKSTSSKSTSSKSTSSKSTADESLANEGAVMLAAAVEDVGRFAEIVIPSVCSPTSLPNHWLQTYRRERCDAALVIAPECDGHLQQIVARMRAGGANVIAPGGDVMAMTSDKWMTAQWCCENRIPHPTTRQMVDCIAEGEFDLGGSRWIIKQRDGCGSLGIYHCLGDFEDGGSSPEQSIVQRFVDGQSVSVVIVGDGSATMTLHPVVQWIDPETFAYRGGEMLKDANLMDRASCLAKRVAMAIGSCNGWIGIDMVLGFESNDDVVIELNARLTTSFVGLRRSTTSNLMAIMFGLGQSPSLWDETIRWTLRDDGVCVTSDTSTDICKD